MWNLGKAEASGGCGVIDTRNGSHPQDVDRKVSVRSERIAKEY